MTRQTYDDAYNTMTILLLDAKAEGVTPILVLKTLDNVLDNAEIYLADENKLADFLWSQFAMRGLTDDFIVGTLFNFVKNFLEQFRPFV